MSRIHYTRFDGHRVSVRWAVVLRRARKDGVKFTLNSGHRTMREQMALFRQNMRWNGTRWVQKAGRPLTAIPSPLAPHIRTGNPAHALDVDSLDGGETRLQHWLERKGVHPTNPVRGESWHMELSRAELTKLWRRYRPKPKPKKAVDMRISQRGLNLIKSFEGFSAKAYHLPGEEFWTIGYGDYGPHVKPGHVITREQAEKRLRHRIEIEFEPGVHKLVQTHINQNRYDALVSLAYNIGLGNFKSSTVLREVNQRHFLRAAAAFHLWVRGANGPLPGLVRRRNAEARLFLRPLSK